MSQGNGWTDAELEGAVDAYLQMLQWEQDGRSYNKSAVNTELRQGPLASRTRGAVEYRMQNISAVLHEHELPWIRGYKPHANVGRNVHNLLRTMISTSNIAETNVVEPTPDPDKLERQTNQQRRQLRMKGDGRRPQGQTKPKTTTAKTKQFYRDSQVQAWVQEQSKGACEACESPAPFTKSNGFPFLEIHHLKRLADGGPDVISNAVAVCPNCHRRLHYSTDKEAFMEHVYKRVKRLERF